nr:hypothetical protein [uncultured Flavobacterium sp.]
MSEKYTANDIATTLNVNIRTAQRYVENVFTKENNKISFDKDVFDLIILRHGNDNQTTTDDTEIITDYFTADEYEEFKKRLIEYPMLKKHIDSLQNELRYHKSQYENLMILHKEFMQLHHASLNNITQRNWIEVKEKGLDNE